jgi:hypothetical protein
MPELLLLVGDAAKARNDNHQRLPAAFRDAGWQVQIADHDQIEMHGGALQLALSADAQDAVPLAGFDLIWPLGFGRLATWFDRMQILASLPEQKFVVSPAALVWLHGKHRWHALMPETHTSASAARLHAVVTSGGDWVLKPPAGSYGRDVRVIRAGAISSDEVHDHLRSSGEGYLMAQRYLPEVEAGEQRTLVAGGELIATYTRLPGAGQTSNLATGGQAVPGNLSDAQRKLVAGLAAELAELGAGFAAIDLVGERLMEVNVANPGGLGTLAEIGTGDFAPAVVAAITRWRSLR